LKKLRAEQGLVLEKYTRALWETAEEHKLLKEVEEGLQRIEGSFQALPELEEYLTSPQVEWKHKLDLTRTLVGGLSPLVVNFVNLVMEKERQFILPLIALEFRKLREQRAKRKQAVVTSAVPLPEEVKTILERRLGELFQQEIILDTKVEPAVVGGIKVQIGHTIIDGTIRRQLEEMRKSIIK
jgi:F-type H+-transporting ATPase subunit delta